MSRVSIKVFRCTVVFSILGAVMFGATGCSEYWWTRGQTPSVKTLVTRAESDFENAKSRFSTTRPDLFPAAAEIRDALTGALAIAERGGGTRQVATLVEACINDFVQLEGKLSIGSRAAFGELSGQLRVIATNATEGKDIEYAPLGLFTARTLFFLANELSVPQPAFG